MAKKKGIKPIYIGLFVCVMMAISTAALYYFNKPKFVRYAAFGIDIPNNYQIHGIDVSHYQQTINWQDVKSMEINNIKIGFSFIKATEGKNDVDAAFKRNWKEAKKAGLARGAYHFFNPYVGGKEQAQNFMQTVVLSKGDLPPVLDVEQIGNVQKEVLQQRIKDWLSEVEKNCKHKPIIYTGATFYNQNLAGIFDEYPLWVAHYLVKDKPKVKRNWHFWQHNEAGHVNGISAYVDFNVFNGDSAAFKNLLIQ